jgi:hypothetical protein
MSRRRLDQKAVAKLVGHAHDMILLRGDHGQHGVGKDVARLLWQMRILEGSQKFSSSLEKTYLAFGNVGAQRPSSNRVFQPT